MPRKRSLAESISARFVEPMQCKPTAKLPDGDEWLYELKLDGYRCLAVKNGADVQLVSRNGKPLNGRFPEIAEAVFGLPIESGVIDGEVVTLDGQGRPSFQLLENSTTSDAPPVLLRDHVNSKRSLRREDPREVRRPSFA